MSTVASLPETVADTARVSRAPRVFTASKIPVFVALGVFVVLFVYGQIDYGKFFTMGTFSTLFNQNAYLIILAVGMTIPILTGGIDLSVGAIVAFSSVVGGVLLTHGVPWYLAAIIIVLIGSLFGLISGTLIRFFDMQPFIATLAMQFVGSGLAAIITVNPIQLTTGSAGKIQNLNYMIMIHKGYRANDLKISVGFIIAIIMVLIAYWVMHQTRAGRTIYAMGAPEKQSAGLMGLSTGSSRSLIYLLSGTFAGVASVVYVASTGSAANTTGQGWELNAITAAVIGGTVITGGSGYVVGSLIGAMVYAAIVLVIQRNGTIPSTLLTVIIGAVLLIFVVLQRLIGLAAQRRTIGDTAGSDEVSGGPPPGEAAVPKDGLIPPEAQVSKASSA